MNRNFMQISRTGLNKQELLVLLTGLTGLIVLILVLGKPPLYDEDDYLMNVALLKKYGFSKLYLLNHIGSAGPLYPTLHYILEAVTGLNTPHIRLVNVVLLIGSTWLIGRTLKVLHLPQSNALLVLAVPMTYVISGLALTEIPAIFFLCAAFYLIIKASYTPLSFLNAAVHISVAGLFLSFAILGRQPFLLVLGALPILFLKNGNSVKNWVLMLITIVFAMALPAFIFSVWGGLVAPNDASLYNSIATGGISLQPIFFFNCLGYYAIVFLIVTPHFYAACSLKEILTLAALALIFIVLNFEFELVRYLPMKYLVEQTFPPQFALWAGTICGAGLFLGSLYFLFTLVRQLITNKFSPALLFFAASIILIALACTKITWGFSSRYPAQAIPFLIPMFAYFYRENKFNSYRLGLGSLLGLISFVSFMAVK